MNCPKCGTSLPDAAKFCYACGSSTAPAPPPPPPPGAGALAPAGAQELKCPSCGAPLKIVFGDPIFPPPEADASEEAYEKLTADLKSCVVAMWEDLRKG